MEWKLCSATKYLRLSGHKSTVKFKINKLSIFIFPHAIGLFITVSPQFSSIFFIPSSFPLISLTYTFSSLLSTGIKWDKTSSWSLLNIFSVGKNCCLCLNIPKLISKLRTDMRIINSQILRSLQSLPVTLDNEVEQLCSVIHPPFSMVILP